jgi:hypothetical protein
MLEMHAPLSPIREQSSTPIYRGCGHERIARTLEQADVIRQSLDAVNRVIKSGEVHEMG